MSVYARTHVNVWIWRPEALDPPEAGVSCGFEPPYMGPLQVQYALLTLVSEHLNLCFFCSCEQRYQVPKRMLFFRFYKWLQGIPQG